MSLPTAIGGGKSLAWKDRLELIQERRQRYAGELDAGLDPVVEDRVFGGQVAGELALAQLEDMRGVPGEIDDGLHQPADLLLPQHVVGLVPIRADQQQVHIAV